MSDESSEVNNSKGKVIPPAPGLENEAPHYQWPPLRDPDLAYQNKSRNPVHSIITALPVIMLVAGLFFYFHDESKQSDGAPILAESRAVTGIFTGLSATSGRHYLWVDVDGVAKGIRIKPEQLPVLEPLQRGSNVEIKFAPSVRQSTTVWAWHVEQSGRVFLDNNQQLR